MINLIAAASSVAQLPIYKPYRTTDPITLDGKLSEPAWNKPEAITDFMQAEPLIGARPSESTEVRMVYNDEYLYIGYRCAENEPSKIVRNNLVRDYEFTLDDGVAIVIDSYNDKSTGMVFATNLNNARRDKGISQDGAVDNVSFNTFWSTKSSIERDEYTVEMRIPFSSLRFANKEKIVMGFRLVRIIRRKGENLVYPRCDPKVDNAYTRVSLAREMEFEHLVSRKPFYITPYAISNFTENYNLASDSTHYIKQSTFQQRKNYVKNEAVDKIISNMGMDLKLGLTKNSTLDLTLNTDFAQAEVDNLIINLSKYDINLPEKRNFFLESEDYFRFNLNELNQLFISRSIGNENGETVPIIAGARLTGIIKGIQSGVLDMQTAAIPATGISPHNFFVLRNEKRFDARGSYFGGIITNRINTGGADHTSNQTIAMDFVKVINPLLSMSLCAAATSTGLNFKPFARITAYNFGIKKYTTEGFFCDAFANYTGGSFLPVMGFIDESGYAEANFVGGYQWKAKAKSKIEYLYLITDDRYRIKTNSGKRETFASDLWPGLSLKNHAELKFSLFEYVVDSLSYNWQLDDKNAIIAGTYAMFKNSITLLTPQVSNYEGTVQATYGDFYGGKRFFISPVIAWRINKHVNADLTYEYNHINFSKYLDQPMTTSFKSNLLRVGFSYFASTSISLKLFSQYDDVVHTIGTNLRFRYNPKEGTDLYIVFNREANTIRTKPGLALPKVNTQGLTIKYQRTFGE